MQPLLTAVIAGTSYLLHPQILATIQETIDPEAVLPVTLLDSSEIYSDHLEQTLRFFASYDDVFVPEFGFALVEKPGSNDTNAAKPNAIEVKYSVTAQDKGNPLNDLPSGPYILHGKNLHPAYRLYDDESGAFASGIIPEKFNETGNFIDIKELSNDTYHPIAVPSKLYTRAPGNKKPLSGVRLTIPENLAVAGTQTTLSSKNWTALYTENESASSDFANDLVQKGAIIVGKTKVSQFAASEEWQDVTSPMNPRADEEQDAGGSAAGAASALSSYDWLSMSVSQDGIDGARERAATYGVYALRATDGAVSKKGFKLSSSKYSNAVLTGRDLKQLHAAASAIHLPSTSSAPFKQIIYPIDFVARDGVVKNLTETFVAVLEKHLGAKAERPSIADLWTKSTPAEAKGKSLNDFLADGPFRTFCYDFYHNFDQFRADYLKKFNTEPFTEPSIKLQWSTGKSVTKSEYDATIRRISVFTKWFNDNIMATIEHSQTLLVSSVEDIQLSELHGLRPELLSPLFGTPQLTIPFAQKPIAPSSPYSIPVASSIMASRRDDIILMQFVQDALKTSKWPSEVQTGRFAFPADGDSSGTQEL